jgi:hypothetical protein
MCPNLFTVLPFVLFHLNIFVNSAIMIIEVEIQYLTYKK